MKAENTLLVTSPAFSNGEMIPKKYTQYGENINPPLNVEKIPSVTKSLALIMTDLDIPFGMTITHWLMWNIPPVGRIEENSVSGVQGKNSMRKTPMQDLDLRLERTDTSSRSTPWTPR